MNKLTAAKQVAILKALTEGSSIRSTTRMVGASKATVLRLLVDAGRFCAIYQDHKLRNLPCRRIEADEIWAFVGAKQRNAKRAGDGDVWTFTALDAETKLMVSWLVGPRSLENAHRFTHDLVSRPSSAEPSAPNGLLGRARSEEHTSELQSPDHL